MDNPHWSFHFIVFFFAEFLINHLVTGQPCYKHNPLQLDSYGYQEPFELCLSFLPDISKF